MGFGKKDLLKVRCPCHHSRSRVSTVDMTITVDVNLSQLAEVASAMVLHCTVIIVPFVMKKYFVGMYSESTYMSCYH